MKSKCAHYDPTKYSAVRSKHFRDDDYEVMFPGLTNVNFQRRLRKDELCICIFPTVQAPCVSGEGKPESKQAERQVRIAHANTRGKWVAFPRYLICNKFFYILALYLQMLSCSSRLHFPETFCCLSLFRELVLSESWQLPLATVSMVLPFPLSLHLNVVELMGGMLLVDNTLLICICPIPAWNQPKATLMFISKFGGPHLPLLCSPEVLISLVLPQSEQGMKNVLAWPCRISFCTLQNDGGPKCVNKTTLNYSTFVVG